MRNLKLYLHVTHLRRLVSSPARVAQYNVKSPRISSPHKDEHEADSCSVSEWRIKRRWHVNRSDTTIHRAGAATTCRCRIRQPDSAAHEPPQRQRWWKQNVLSVSEGLHLSTSDQPASTAVQWPSGHRGHPLHDGLHRHPVPRHLPLHPGRRSGQQPVCVRDHGRDATRHAHYRSRQQRNGRRPESDRARSLQC